MGHVRLEDSSFALNDVDLALADDGEAADGITTVSNQSLMVMSDVQLIFFECLPAKTVNYKLK